MKPSKVLNLIFFGPQGSGKGTQAKILAEKLKLKHLSSGEALRITAKSNTSLGRHLRNQLSSGRLTPIPKLIQVFGTFIRKIPQRQGLVLDGFARQITETRILLRKLKELGRAIDATVMIDISERETIKRLFKRAQCSACNRIYILGGKIKPGGKCPACGGVLFQRDDDKPAAIKKRLAMYRKRTLPVIRFFKRQGLHIHINGEQAVPAVHRDIMRALKRKKLVI